MVPEGDGQAKVSPSLAATVGPLASGNEGSGAQSTEAFDFLAPAQNADELGRLGPYRVLKVLGRGGMGVVFLAEDTGLQRTVALKAMLPGLARKPGAKDRFMREARAAAKLEHDNLVPIYQVDEERGVPYIAMPLLKGLTLEDWLNKRKPGAPLTPAQILKIGREMARGLAAAHEHGLIHRDIKPANIWLDAAAGGRAKILDFGLARGTAGEQTLTQSGVILGTPAYMAPEQARSEQVDARADLFSLGVVLYRLATGRLPFVGHDTMSTLMALALNDPVPPRTLNPALPGGLADLISALLVKDPSQRIATASEVGKRIYSLEKELQQADATVELSGPMSPPAAAPPAGFRQRIFRFYRSQSRWRLAVGGAALLVGLVFGGILLRTIGGRSEQQVLEPRNRPGPSQGLPAPPKETPLSKETSKIVPEPTALATPQPPAPRQIIPDPTAHILKGHNGPVRQVRILPDGKRGVSVAWDGTARLWDLATGKEVTAFHAEKILNSVALSPDGKRVAVGGTNHQVHQWNLETLAPEPGLRLSGAGEEAVGALAYSPDGSRVFVGTGSGSVWVFQSNNGQRLSKAKVFKRGLSDIQPLPDGRSVWCSVAFENDLPEVVLWDVDAEIALKRIRVPAIGALRVAPFGDGKRIATVHQDNTARIWSIETGSELATIYAHPGPAIRATGVHVLHKDQWLLTTGEDKAIRIWDIRTRALLHQITADHFVTSQSAVSADGRLLLSGAGWRLTSRTDRDDDFTLRLWRLPVP